MSPKEDLRSEINELKERVSKLETKIESNPKAVAEATDMRSFVRGLTPDSHKERAVAIAYYLEHYENQREFTTKDIEEGYRTCRVRPPANLSDTLSDCENEGWVLRTGEDGHTQIRELTGDGMEYVEEMLKDGA